MSPRSRLFVALVSTALTGYILLGSLLGRVLGDSTYGQLALFNEVVRLVLEAYVEPVNVDRALAGARLGLTEALDGDSSYLDQEEFRAWQQQPRDNEADVGLLLTRRLGFLMVVAPRPGSPAEKAGVRPGDIVKSIDARHTRPLAPFAGQRLLRGAPGSLVKVSLLRAGSDPIELSLVRERLAAPQVKGRVLESGTGYVKVAEITGHAAEDIRGEIETLRRAGARRLVLDLRGAAFGSPADGVKVAELFLKGGVVAKLAGAKHAEEVLSADPARSAWDLPVATLVDIGTAGAGEVVAAALLDAGRGEVVGQRTFGRAPFQKAVPLPEGGLIVTVAKYASPKGTAIHGKGVEPSVAVELPDEPDGDAEPAAPARDLTLEKALEILEQGATQKKAA
ncbi:MAG TPA: S41 family peptidase [Vicinamibacteria bacterium]|nr:S41 family peptidase [Vicinamibacteria bacterium]